MKAMRRGGGFVIYVKPRWYDGYVVFFCFFFGPSEVEPDGSFYNLKFPLGFSPRMGQACARSLLHDVQQWQVTSTVAALLRSWRSWSVSTHSHDGAVPHGCSADFDSPYNVFVRIYHPSR